jgi:hypothetical protein
MSSGFYRMGANVPGKRLDWSAGHVPPAVIMAAVPSIGFHATLRDPAPIIDPSPSLTRRAAVQQGYTGDQCSNCFGMRTQVAGHCTVCADCGTTTGCS